MLLSHVPRYLSSGLSALRAGERAAGPPVFLQIEPSTACNERCIGCPRDKVPDRIHLRAADLAEILDRVRPLRVLFSGRGEPLLNPWIFDLVALAASRGLHTAVNSNFTVLRPGEEEKILKSGLKSLRVSMDGDRPETYARLRGFDGFETIRANFGRIAEARRVLRRPGPKVHFNTVVQRENLAELAGIVRLARRLGAPSVYFILPLYWDEDRDRWRRLANGPDREGFRGALREAAEEARRLGVRTSAPRLLATLDRWFDVTVDAKERPRMDLCRKAWFSVTLDARGEVIPCCNLKYSGITMGNVLREGFEGIWNGEAYRRFRATMAGGRPPTPECRRCVPRTLPDFLAWANR